MQTRQSIRRKQTAGVPSASDLKPWELCWHTDGKLYIGVGESAGHAASVAQITGADAPIAWGDIQNAPAYATRWPKWSEVTQRPTIPTNNTQLTNGRGYVTTDTNTTYSAGAALDLSGTQFNVQAASKTLLGRYSAGTGNAQGITLGDGLSLSGSGELSTAPAPNFDVVKMWDFATQQTLFGAGARGNATLTFLSETTASLGALRVTNDATGNGGLSLRGPDVGTKVDHVYVCARTYPTSAQRGYFWVRTPGKWNGIYTLPDIPADGEFHVVSVPVTAPNILDGTEQCVGFAFDPVGSPNAIYDIKWIALGRSQRPAYSVGAVNHIEVTNTTPTSDATKSGTLYLKY